MHEAQCCYTFQPAKVLLVEVDLFLGSIEKVWKCENVHMYSSLKCMKLVSNELHFGEHVNFLHCK